MELAELPARIAVDPTTEVLSRVTAFCKALQDIVHGRSESKTFVHTNRDIYEEFKIAIRATAPNFQPFTDVDFYRSEEVQADGTTRRVDLVQRPMYLYDVRRVIKECVRSSMHHLPRSSRLNRSIGWELPHNIPYDAKTLLFKEFLVLWPEPKDTCLGAISTILNETIDREISVHFERFKPLESHIGCA